MKNNKSKWDIHNMNGDKILSNVGYGFVFHFMTFKGCLSSLFTVHKRENVGGRIITGENMTGEQYLAKYR